MYRARSLGLASGLVILVSAVVGMERSRLAAADAAAEATTRLSSDIKYLASDELEGRGVGTKGLDLAADFVRKELQKAGLKVQSVGSDGFHKFTMTTGSQLGTPNTLQLVGPEGKSIDLALDKDFRVCSFGGAGTFDTKVVFCGYGIDAADQKYSDFQGVDVKGKVVILMRRTPQQGVANSPFEGPHGATSRHADLRTKVSNAYGKGAAAILLVNDPYSLRESALNSDKKIVAAEKAVAKAAEAFEAATIASSSAKSVKAGEKPADAAQLAKKLLESREALSRAVKLLQNTREVQKAATHDQLLIFGYGGYGSDRTLPVLHVSVARVDELLKSAAKKSLADLEREIDKSVKPQSFVLKGWKARGKTSITKVQAEVKNVVAVLEGSGPLADETIVVGAHYDHVGYGLIGSLGPRNVRAVHNGADDNASGTVALIETARRLAARKDKLPRRVVFIAFTAEELGLIGSARYVKEPLFPLEKTIAMFNMDMVGRLTDDKLTVFGTGTSPGFRELVERVGKDLRFKLTLKPEGFGPSDHSSFYARKIPVLHLFTGTHSDYHRPTDDWEKINIAGINRVVEMMTELVVTTANAKERPQYVEVKRQASLMDRGGSRPYFGSIPDFGGDIPGYAISGVAPGSPAANGGLQGGDVIVQFGGQKIGSLDDFDLALRKFKAGSEVPVVVIRKGKQVPLKVKLGTPR